MRGASARVVLFDRYGGRDVLYVADVPMPIPSSGEVVVAVKAAGINPGEMAIRSGALDHRFPQVSFGRGKRSRRDFHCRRRSAGILVEPFEPRHSCPRASVSADPQASGTQLDRRRKPLCRALNCLRRRARCEPWSGRDRGGARGRGGVGTVVVQLLAQRDATVLWIASASNADWLRSHGAVPVPYGDGLGDRLEAEAFDGIDAVIDLFGPEYVQLAVDFDIARDRIETIASFESPRAGGQG